jgi:hypothetical protein
VNTMDKILFRISLLMLGVMSITLLLVAYWMFWPIEILRITRTEVLTSVVKRGEYLRYLVTYTKICDIQGEVHRSLVNDRTVSLVVGDSSRKKLGSCLDEIDVFIPTNMWSGKYKLRVDVIYEVNPLRSVRVTYYTDWFEIR